MSKVRRDRLKERQEDALERQEARASRSNSEQIAHLDRILGKGKGAVKERARLAKQEAAPKKATKSKAKAKDTNPKVKQKAKDRRAADKKSK